jgi:anaerobic magnesium-protoporphyrin IX monomethyl ester cyclase
VHVLFIIKEIDNEPHGILRVSAALKQAGHTTDMVVATEEDPVEAALRIKPDVLAYSVYTGTQRYYLDVNRRIREQLDVYTIMGGPHPTFFPEIIEEEGVDAICIGEGEHATVDLINALEKGDAVEGIPNWWVKSNGRIHRNGLRPLVADLDELPVADRELLYRAHPLSRQRKLKPFITGRGCPYNCSFCFNEAYSQLYEGKGRRTRRRSVENVIREIQEVRKEYPLDFVLFLDDTFIINRKWLHRLAKRYKEEVGLPFWCQVRPNLVTEEKVALFKDMGCVSVSFGLETANDRLRYEVLNRHITKEQILKACRILRKHGIKYSTNNMLGLPTGGLETDLETLDLNIECRADYVNVFLYQPYPKTKLGEMALREGLMTGTFDDLSGSVSDDTVIKFGSEGERRQIENLQKLLSVTAEFPFLKSLVVRLIKLPPNELFWLVYKGWKGYAISRRIYPVRMTLREWFGALLQFMRIRTQ